MSHAGMTVCPHCGAQFLVPAQAIGVQTPCLTCGRPFVIQVAAEPTTTAGGADPLGIGGSSAVGLPAANPLGTSAMTLRPSVYAGGQGGGSPLPWGWIAGGIGAAVVIVVIVSGVGFAVSGTFSGPANVASPPPSSGSADSPQSPPSANQGGLVAQAVKAAGEVVSAQLPVKVFADSHDSCLSESLKLQNEARQLSEQLGRGVAGDIVLGQARELAGKMRELAIRWHALPPMTEVEREAINKRLTARVWEELKQKEKQAAPAKQYNLLTDDTPLAAMFEIMGPADAISGVLDAARKPFPAADCPLDERYVEMIQSCGAIVRHLNSIKSAADCQRLQGAVDEEAAKVNGVLEKVLGMKHLTRADAQATERKYADQFAHEQRMAEVVMTQVLFRAGHKSGDENVPEHLQPLLAGLKDLYGRHYRAVHDLRAEIVKLQSNPPQQPPATDVASLIAKALGSSQPRPDAEEKPQTQPGPRRTFGELVAADVERYQRELGRDKVLLVTAKGGTAARRQALEDELVALIQPSRRAKLDGKDTLAIVLHYEGDVQQLADKIRAAKVLRMDAANRAIEVALQ
jgi:hypothetical protein